jgi:aryl-alcohol dehydrogenase-like predicted oxidoreductase
MVARQLRREPAVKYRPLGRTGLTVSEIGFGAWGIGGRTSGTTSYGDTDDATSLAALRRALDCGITFFDTSSAYGDGHSEALIGEAFSGRRDKVVIATKAGYDSWDQPPDFSPAAVVASADRSLARLRSDYLDLLQLHNPPVEALREGALLDALARLQKAGKIRAWGVSAKSPAEAIEALVEFGAPVVQANFNMMDVRAVDSGLLDQAAQFGAGFIGRTPLCFGFLSGTIGRDTVFPPGDHRLGWSRAQLDNWIDGAKDLLAAVQAQPGREAVQAALRFCLAQPPISTVIPGILTAAEAEDCALASEAGPLANQVVEGIIGINRARRFFVRPLYGTI